MWHFKIDFNWISNSVHIQSNSFYQKYFVTHQTPVSQWCQLGTLMSLSKLLFGRTKFEISLHAISCCFQFTDSQSASYNMYRGCHIRPYLGVFGHWLRHIKVQHLVLGSTKKKIKLTKWYSLMLDPSIQCSPWLQFRKFLKSWNLSYPCHSFAP